MLTLSCIHPFTHLFSPPSLPCLPSFIASILPSLVVTYMYIYMYFRSLKLSGTHILTLSPTVQGELPSFLLSVMVVRGEVRVVPVVESEHCEDATQGLWENSLFLKEGDAGIIVSEASLLASSTCPLSVCLYILCPRTSVLVPRRLPRYAQT